MASLTKLEAYDNEIDMCSADIENVQKMMAAADHRRAWSPEQSKIISVLIGSIWHLRSALEELVKPNR